MPSSAAVTDQLVDIVVRVLDCDPDDVVPDALLQDDLGADSLTIVEIGEELGRRFDLYLSDDTINGLRRVKDAVHAVVGHDGTGPGRQDHPPVPASPLAFSSPAGTGLAVEQAPELADPALPTTDSHLLTGAIEPDQAKHRAWILTRWLGVAGLVVGAVVGLAFVVLVGATGLDDVSLPPLPSATTAPTPTATTPSPTPTSTAPDEVTEEPTLTAEQTRVSPGQRFVLSGRFPGLGPNAVLQVQFRENGGSWEDFPVQAKTRDEGAFKTELYTSRTGEREFRLKHDESGATTPTVKVTIG